MNEQAYFRFYAELNDFLPRAQRQQPIPYPLPGRVAVKHAIEALGIPHTEVALILANGTAVDFSYLLQPEDRIAVYPAFKTLDVTPLQQVRPPLPNPLRFVVDGHLGRLATWLRLLGFDALYETDCADEALARITAATGRILLTRDRRLLMRKRVTYGYCVRTRDPEQQLRDVLHRYDLFDAIDPWQRCLRCNGSLQPVAKEKILDRLEPLTKRHYEEFQQCQDCGQVYWKGSHFARLQAFIAGVQERAGTQG